MTVTFAREFNVHETQADAERYAASASRHSLTEKHIVREPAGFVVIGNFDLFRTMKADRQKLDIVAAYSVGVRNRHSRSIFPNAF